MVTLGNILFNTVTQVLLMLEERNLVEMGVNVIGDRLMILSYLKLLKKKKVRIIVTVGFMFPVSCLR